MATLRSNLFSTPAALLALSALVSAPLGAEVVQPVQPPTPQLAVLEFKNLTGDRSDQRKSEVLFLADQARNRIKDSLPWLGVITRENVLALLTAQGKTLEQCEGECEIETGRRLGADYVVSGELFQIGGELRLSLKLHDTRTSALLRGLSVAGNEARGLEEALKKAVPDLLAPLLETTGGATPSFRIERPILGDLLLSVDPPDATYQLDGGSSGNLGATGQRLITLPLGRHRVLLRRKGYQDTVREVLIQAGAPVTLKETLLAPQVKEVAAGNGYLTVESMPPGARILLDGTDSGKETPATFSDLSPGAHEVVLKKTLYLDHRERKKLPDAAPQLLTVTLTPDFGTLALTSGPPGATITLDGQEQEARTPMSFERLASGAHRVRLTLPRHEPDERTLLVEPGGTARWEALLKPTFAAVAIGSKPPGASVHLNGELRGQTPLVLELERGMYRLRLTMPLYAEHAQALVVEAGRDQSITSALRARFGSLELIATAGGLPIEGAEGFVQGEGRGALSPNSPLVIDRIPEGTVVVEVRAPLHATWSREVMILPGPPQRLSAELVAEYGLLEAKSDQPARVELDGQGLGPADGRRYKVKIGSRRVVFLPEAPARYRPFGTVVLLEPLKTERVEGLLTPRLGKLVVQSTPSGALLIIDGRKAGTTPTALDLFAGTAHLALKKERYLDWSGTTFVKEGETVALEATLKGVDLAEFEARQRVRYMGYASAGAAVLAAGTAGILGWQAQVAANKWSTARNYPTWSSARDRTNALVTATTTTWIGAGVLAVVGGILIWNY